MWTMLVSPTVAVLASALHGPVFLLSYVLWILLSRMLLSLLLYGYAKRVDLSFPFLLYANQLLNAVVKVHILFRLARQRWSNRGGQKAGFDAGWRDLLRGAVAGYLTLFYVSLLFLATAAYARAFDLTSLRMAGELFRAGP